MKAVPVKGSGRRFFENRILTGVGVMPELCPQRFFLIGVHRRLNGFDLKTSREAFPGSGGVGEFHTGFSLYAGHGVIVVAGFVMEKD